MGLNGATAGAFISYTFPMMVHLKIKWKILKTWEKVYFNYLFIYLFFLLFDNFLIFINMKILNFFILIISIPAGIYITIITLINLIETLK
jgi:hypothetical protein